MEKGFHQWVQTFTSLPLNINRKECFYRESPCKYFTVQFQSIYTDADILNSTMSKFMIWIFLLFIRDLHQTMEVHRVSPSLCSLVPAVSQQHQQCWCGTVRVRGCFTSSMEPGGWDAAGWWDTSCTSSRGRSEFFPKITWSSREPGGKDTKQSHDMGGSAILQQRNSIKMGGKHKSGCL